MKLKTIKFKFSRHFLLLSILILAQIAFLANCSDNIGNVLQEENQASIKSQTNNSNTSSESNTNPDPNSTPDYVISYFQIEQNEASLPARWASSIAQSGKNVLIYGGKDSGMVRNDLWQYDTDTGNATLLTNGEARAFASMTLLDQKLYIFGGLDYTGTETNTLITYDLVNKTWYQFLLEDTIGTAPKSRYAHSALYYQDPVSGNKKILIYGGFSDAQVLKSDLYELDLSATPKPKWSKKASGPFVGGHGAVILGDYMYLLGGLNRETQTYLNELWSYDITLDSWQLTSTLPANTPGVEGLQLVSLNNQLYAYGGKNDLGYTNALWQFTFPGSWQKISLALPPLAYYSAVSFTNKIMTFGGISDQNSSGLLIIQISN
jgi:hypothetical protein